MNMYHFLSALTRSSTVKVFATSAVRLLLDGHASVMVGLDGKRVVHTTLEDVCNTVKPIDTTMCTLVEELAV